MTKLTLTRRGEAGYNLVEVLLAMAMLGVVTISIFTLFFMGRRNVFSGKQTSQAIAIATQVIEDLQPLNRQMLYSGAFNIAAGAGVEQCGHVSAAVVTFSEEQRASPMPAQVGDNTRITIERI